LERHNETENNLEETVRRLQHLASATALPSIENIHRGISRLSIQITSNQSVKLPYEKLLGRRNPQFFARNLILRQITDIFDQGIKARKMAAVTLDGLGGVGKTQIAHEFAHSQRGKRDAIIWIHSEKVVSMDLGLSAAAVELGLSGAVIHDHPNNRRLLLNWLQTTGIFIL
jgi:hypothetical protein